MRDRLDRKLSVVLFPEGTRSPDGSLGEFREGAFRLAIEAGVDVLPMAIVGAAGGLPKHAFVFHPAKADLVVLTPEPTAGLTAADASRLAAKVRGRIAEAIRARQSARRLTGARPVYFFQGSIAATSSSSPENTTRSPGRWPRSACANSDS